MSKVYIYALVDPNTGDVGYIGKTESPRTRYLSHISSSKEMATDKDVWIQSLVSEGKSPEMRIIEECSKDTWKDREVHWILHYRSIGQCKTNVLDGGQGGNSRPTAYPYTFLARITPELDARLQAIIDKDPTKTKVGLVRDALDKLLPKKITQKDSQS